MTTTALPRGRLHKLRLAYDATFGTAPVTGFFGLHAYPPIRFDRGRPLADDDVTGDAFNNSIDDTPPAPGLEDATGSLSVPFDLTQIGYWLKAHFGAASDSGSADYTHVFTSAGLTTPTITLERQIATGQFEELIGAVSKSMKFSVGPEAGYHQVAIDLMARQQTESYASTVAGTPTGVALANRVPKSRGYIKIGGSQVGSVLSGDLTLTNTFLADRYADDSHLVSLFSLTGRSAAVAMTARYNTDALRLLGENGANDLPTVQAVEFDWILSSTLKLVIALPNVRFQPVSAPVESGGVITQSLVGRAEVASAANAVTATLYNQTASY